MRCTQLLAGVGATDVECAVDVFDGLLAVDDVRVLEDAGVLGIRSLEVADVVDAGGVADVVPLP